MQIEFHNDAINIVFTNEQDFDTKIKRLEREIMLPYHIYLLNGIFKHISTRSSDIEIMQDYSCPCTVNKF